MCSPEQALLKAVEDNNLDALQYALKFKPNRDQAFERAKELNATQCMEMLYPGSTRQAKSPAAAAKTHAHIGGTSERPMVIGEGASVSCIARGNASVSITNCDVAPGASVLLFSGEKKQEGKLDNQLVRINGVIVDAGNWPEGIELKIGVGFDHVWAMRENHTLHVGFVGSQNIDIFTVPGSWIQDLHVRNLGPSSSNPRMTGSISVVLPPHAAPMSDVTHTPTEIHAPPAPPNECALCLNNPATQVIVPCGHQCCCAKCVSLLKSIENAKQCPICREFGNVIHIAQAAPNQRIFA